MQLPEKKEKRIDSLIKSSQSIMVVAVILLFLAPLGLLLMVACFMYYVESKLLLKTYGEELNRPKKKQLKAACRRYLFVGIFMLVVYCGVILAIVFAKP
jgi:uncharacterized membrane protein (DUF485 family)